METPESLGIQCAYALIIENLNGQGFWEGCVKAIHTPHNPYDRDTPEWEQFRHGFNVAIGSHINLHKGDTK